MTDAPLLTPTARVAQAYLLLLPVGHLVGVPVAGAMATGADLMLGVLVAVWVVELAVGRGVALGALGPPGRRYLMGILALMAFGGWVALSGLWSAFPAYAAAKGVAMVALAVGALALATSGLGWRGVADAWLAGTGLALVATVVLWVVGLTGVVWAQERVAMGGTGITGLPFPRVSGPFLHPNMFGDYLVVSAALLWGRWAELGGAVRRAAPWFAGSLAVALAATVSTAWIGAGVAAAAVGWVLVREGRSGPGWALGVVGVAVAVATTAFVTLQLRVSILGLDLVTNGIRPAIWASSVEAFLASPWVGVGAAPYLARAADPLLGGAVGFWDAHNAFLSVLAQFGVVGGVLLGVGGWLVVSGLRGGERGPGVLRDSRARVAVSVAVVVVAVHALFLASEDLRHVWALAGVVGALGVFCRLRPVSQGAGTVQL